MSENKVKKGGRKNGAVGIILILLALVAIVGGTLLYGAYYDRRSSNFTSGAELYVYPGTSAEDVISQIREKCGVKKERSLRRSFSSQLKHADIKPGHYTVIPSNSSMYVARMVTNGWQSPVNLVLSGSMRSDTVIAKKISSQMMVDSLDVVVALRNPELKSNWVSQGL